MPQDVRDKLALQLGPLQLAFAAEHQLRKSGYLLQILPGIDPECCKGELKTCCSPWVDPSSGYCFKCQLFWTADSEPITGTATEIEEEEEQQQSPKIVEIEDTSEEMVQGLKTSGFWVDKSPEKGLPLPSGEDEPMGEEPIQQQQQHEFVWQEIEEEAKRFKGEEEITNVEESKLEAGIVTGEEGFSIHQPVDLEHLPANDYLILLTMIDEMYKHTQAIGGGELTKRLNDPKKIRFLRQFCNNPYLGNGMGYSTFYWDEQWEHAISSLMQFNKREYLEFLDTDPPPKIDWFSHEEGYRQAQAIMAHTDHALLGNVLLRTAIAQASPSIGLMGSGFKTEYVDNHRLGCMTWKTKKVCQSADGRDIFFIPDLEEPPFMETPRAMDMPDIVKLAMMTWVRIGADGHVNYNTIMIPITRWVPENLRNTVITASNRLVDFLKEERIDVAVRFMNNRPHSLVVVAAGKVSVDSPKSTLSAVGGEGSPFPFILAEFRLFPMAHGQIDENASHHHYNTYLAERESAQHFLPQIPGFPDLFVTSETTSLRFMMPLDTESGQTVGLCHIMGIVKRNIPFYASVRLENMGVASKGQTSFTPFRSKLPGDDQGKPWEAHPCDPAKGIYYFTDGRRVYLFQYRLTSLGMDIQFLTAKPMILKDPQNSIVIATQTSFFHNEKPIEGLTVGPLFMQGNRNLVADKHKNIYIRLDKEIATVHYGSQDGDDWLPHSFGEGEAEQLFYFDNLGMGRIVSEKIISPMLSLQPKYYEHR